MVMLDNIGKVLALLFRAPTTAILDQSGFQDFNDVNITLRIYGTSANNTFNKVASDGTIKIGAGSSVVTRQDFNVEIPFIVSPESTFVVASTGGYNSGLGLVTMNGLISNLGGSGTITEVTRNCNWLNSSGVTKTLAIMRDLPTPAPFVAGESVNVNHEVSI